MTQRRRGWIIGGAVLLLLLGLASLVALPKIKGRMRSPNRLHAQAEQLLRRGDATAAYQRMREALAQEPSNTNLLHAAAIIASAAGNQSQASDLARQAWRAGVHNPDLLRIITANVTPADRANAWKELRAYLANLPAGPDRSQVEGDLLMRLGREQEARTVWLEAFNQKPTADLAARIVQLYTSAGQPAEAVKFLAAQLNRGVLGGSGYAMLAGMQALLEDSPTNALATIQAAEKAGKYNDDLRVQHATLLMLQLRDDEALERLQPFLEQSERQNTNQLPRAARLFAAYVATTRTNKTELTRLRSLAAASPTSREREAELLFFDGALASLEGKESALPDLANAHRLLAGHPTVELMFGAESLRRGKPQDAVGALGKVQGPMRRWPPLLITLAKAHMAAGEPIAAAAMLELLRRQGFVNRDTLELERDTAIAANRVQAAQQIQAFLEKAYPTDPDVALFRAFQLMAVGDFAQADAVIGELSARYPENLRIIAARVQSLIGQRKFDEALRTIDADNDRDALLTLRAFTLARASRLSEAADAYKAALRGEESARVYVEYGKVLGMLERMDDSLGQFRKALELDPRLAEARLGLALGLYRQGKLAEARKERDAIVAARDARNAGMLIPLAQAELEKGQPAEAANLANLALTANPSLTAARVVRGQASLALGRAADAIADLSAAVNLEPNDPALRLVLAGARLQAQQWATALEDLDRVLARNATNAAALLMRFDALAGAGRLDEAASHLAQCKPRLPAPAYAVAAASLEERKGNLEPAVRLLEPHLDAPAAALAWARLQIRLGKDQGLTEVLKKHQFTAGAWASLGLIADQLNRIPTAAALYREALALDPENPSLLNNWAWAALRLPNPDLDAALKAAEKAHTAAPQDLNILDTYAEALLRLNRPRECASALDRNATLISQNPQLLYLLGVAQEQSGNKAGARSAYRQSLQLASAKSPWPLRVSKEQLQQAIQRVQ